MSKAFIDTCNYGECENKNNCVRYSKQGAYDMKIVCANRDYKWMVNKETELIVNGEKLNECKAN